MAGYEALGHVRQPVTSSASSSPAKPTASLSANRSDFIACSFHHANVSHHGATGPVLRPVFGFDDPPVPLRSGFLACCGGFAAPRWCSRAPASAPETGMAAGPGGIPGSFVSEEADAEGARCCGSAGSAALRASHSSPAGRVERRRRARGLPHGEGTRARLASAAVGARRSGTDLTDQVCHARPDPYSGERSRIRPESSPGARSSVMCVWSPRAFEPPVADAGFWSSGLRIRTRSRRVTCV